MIKTTKDKEDFIKGVIKGTIYGWPGKYSTNCQVIAEVDIDKQVTPIQMTEGEKEIAMAKALEKFGTKD